MRSGGGGGGGGSLAVGSIVWAGPVGYLESWPSNPAGGLRGKESSKVLRVDHRSLNDPYNTSQVTPRSGIQLGPGAKSVLKHGN